MKFPGLVRAGPGLEKPLPVLGNVWQLLNSQKCLTGYLVLQVHLTLGKGNLVLRLVRSTCTGAASLLNLSYPTLIGLEANLSSLAVC